MKIIPVLQSAFIWLYTFILAIVVGATVYQMMVIVPEFTRDMPTSMIALANSTIKPGNFWGSPIFGISGLVLPIIAIILNWKTPRRKWLLLSFGFGIAASVFTTVYFYPRLHIMGLLGEAPTTDIPLLIRTIKEWIFADYFRFSLNVVPAFFLALKAATVSQAHNRQKIADKYPVQKQHYAVAESVL